MKGFSKLSMQVCSESFPGVLYDFLLLRFRFIYLVSLRFSRKKNCIPEYSRFFLGVPRFSFLRFLNHVPCISLVFRDVGLSCCLDMLHVPLLSLGFLLHPFDF